MTTVQRENDIPSQHKDDKKTQHRNEKYLTWGMTIISAQNDNKKRQTGNEKSHFLDCHE